MDDHTDIDGNDVAYDVDQFRYSEAEASQVVDLTPVLTYLESISYQVECVRVNTLASVGLSALLMGVVLGVSVSKLLSRLWG